MRALGAVFVGLLLAMLPVATAHASTDPPASVVGTVTSGGQPVAGVTVSAITKHPGEPVTTTTAADGTYRLDGLASVSTQVCFDGTDIGVGGYEYVCVKLRPYPGSTATVDKSLAEGGAVVGTVTDVHGHPLQHAQVYVIDPVVEGFTGTDGAFRLGGIPAGKHISCVTADPAYGNSPTGYAPSPSCYTGETLHVSTGKALTEDVVLQRGAELSGVVTDAATGQPLAGVTVFVNGGVGAYATTRANGSWAIEALAAGSDGYAVYPPSGYQQGCTGTEVLKVGQTKIVDCMLTPSAQHAGRDVRRLTPRRS